MNHQLRGWIWCFWCLILALCALMLIIGKNKDKEVSQWFLSFAILCFFNAYYHLGEGPVIKKLREEVDREREKRDKVKKKGDN